MPKTKIAFFDMKVWDMPDIADQFPDAEVITFDTPLCQTDTDQIQDVDILSVFIHCDVSRAVLDKLPNVKMISTRSTGYNHIDLQACAERNITVSNVPRYGRTAVAEHTFALLLAVARNIHQSYINADNQDFSLHGLMGADLAGKTFGVFGAGAIAQSVIRIANGFDMNVIVYDIHPDEKKAQELNYTNVSKEELLAQSDIITLHIPYNQHTHHFISTDEFAQMKPGTILINTARGGIIDTDALIVALDDGTLAGAGLDVLENETPLIHGDRNGLERELQLIDRPNVVFTPHIAFFSQEAVGTIMQITQENIEAFESGAPQNTL